MAYNRGRRSSRPAALGIAVALFVLAAGTRAVALGSFSWPDELTWLQRSAAFVVALERGDLASTYLADHPGVVPMWGYGAALVARALVSGDRSAIDALAAVAREADTPPDIPAADIPGLLATAALFTVAVTSLAVVAAYALCVPLLGRAGALLAGLLLALDPFFLSHSRIVHVDALLASFMLLSVLSLVRFTGGPGRRQVRYLFLSGLMAGLAMLTKTPSLFLVPFAALLLGGQWLWQRLRGLEPGKYPAGDAADAWTGAEPGRYPAGDAAAAWAGAEPGKYPAYDGQTPGTGLGPGGPEAGAAVPARRRSPRPAAAGLVGAAAAFIAWLATMYATFVLLWPAAWQRPLFLTHRLYMASRWAGIVSHGSNFFMGQAVDDPGPLFYAVVLPFRLSPLVMMLLLAAAVLLIAAVLRRARPLPAGSGLAAAGLVFVLFFTIMVSLAAKKGDRYLLPVYPLADVVAAWGLLRLVDLLGTRRAKPFSAVVGTWAAGALIAVTALLWLPLAPYYGAYFNPLLGGGPVAVHAFSFGQGEGLDLAARYLNGQENSRELLAVSFYPQQLRYYLDGQVTSLRRGEWDQTWQFADYVVFYVSQVQRKLPSAPLVDLFSAQQPAYTARLGGVDWALVYPSPVLLSGRPPAVDRRLAGATLGDVLQLDRFALANERPRAGREVEVTLYWRAAAQMGLDYDLILQLAAEDGRVVWEQVGQPYAGYMPTSWWPPGRPMLDRYRVALPAGLAPGRYWLLAGAGLPGGEPLSPAGALDPRWPDRLALGSVDVD